MVNCRMVLMMMIIQREVIEIKNSIYNGYQLIGSVYIYKINERIRNFQIEKVVTA
jgi:hypothetical protein